MDFDILTFNVISSGVRASGRRSTWRMFVTQMNSLTTNVLEPQTPWQFHVVGWLDRFMRSIYRRRQNQGSHMHPRCWTIGEVRYRVRSKVITGYTSEREVVISTAQTLQSIFSSPKTAFNRFAVRHPSTTHDGTHCVYSSRWHNP